MQEIVAKLDSVASRLIETEATDLSALESLQKHFAELSADLGQQSSEVPSQAARASAQLIESCLTGTGADPESVLRILARGIEALQGMVRDNRDLLEVSFPSELLRDGAATFGEARSNPRPSSEQTSAVDPESAALATDPDLLFGFVAESQEHLEIAESHLLTLEEDPSNEESIDAVFRAFHTIKGVAGFLNLTTISKLSHEAENLLDMARKGELALAGAAMDASFASVDALKRQVKRVQDGVAQGFLSAPDDSLDHLLTTLRAIAHGDGVGNAWAETAGPMAEAANDSPGPSTPWKTHEPDVEVGEVEAAPVARSQPAAEARSVSRRQAHPEATAKETVRVDRDRLDKLVDTIGELVIAESMVHQIVGKQEGDVGGGSRQLAHLNKITRELQELSLSLRMVPIRGTFQKMARLVRDLSKQAGKPIDFQMMGEDTELDKTVVDRIGDPLIHMVRNSVDHGIEASSEERTAAGKPARGKITLRAFHQGGNIYVELEDDGRGLDRSALLAKAKQRGLVRDGEKLTDQEVFNLIFLPGFSTAQKVTDVSGRGVGMDVVRRNIEALHGSVEIRSRAGKGSTISLRLPLTLAIIDGMVVRVGGNRYVIPTPAIVELLRPAKKDISTVAGRAEMLSMRGQLLPLFRIASLFGISGAKQDPLEGIVVVVEDGGQRVGMLVDEIVGQQQVVIKGLGTALEGLEGLAGGAVMPDGRVGLILDVHGITSLARGGRDEAA